MLLLKACPRCHGDLVLESDKRCAYLECVQCGHTLSLQEERMLGVRATRGGCLRAVGPMPETTMATGEREAAR